MAAPIALFAYARLRHTQRTVAALLQNALAKDSDLIIFSDDAQTIDMQIDVDEVRAYLITIAGFRSIKIHCRPYNFGLAKSIISGVAEVLNNYERVIVLEDDLETSPFFLTYMNEALEKYAEDDRVASIHGYVYPVKKSLPAAFFMRGADCWGWATWKRAWAHFNPDGQYLLAELRRKKLINEFDFNGAYAYSTMLEDHIRGKNDSWAVRWHASAFLANKLTLYPGRSLIFNIGFDGAGTNCGISNVYDTALSATPIDLSLIEVSSSIVAYQAFEDFFRQAQGGLMRKTYCFLIATFRKIAT